MLFKWALKSKNLELFFKYVFDDSTKKYKHSLNFESSRFKTISEFKSSHTYKAYVQGGVRKGRIPIYGSPGRF